MVVLHYRQRVSSTTESKGGQLSAALQDLRTVQQSMAKRSSAVIVANWLAFLSLFSAFLMLMLHGIKYKGPGRKHKYFHGFREQNM